MIKSLTSDGGMHPNIHDCMDKINELVDVVNAFLLSGEPEIPIEQRKWIGKVCRFWNDDETEWEPTVNVLDQLRTESDFLFVTPNGVGYKHCEPITADDELIYKGE